MVDSLSTTFMFRHVHVRHYLTKRHQLGNSVAKSVPSCRTEVEHQQVVSIGCYSNVP